MEQESALEAESPDNRLGTASIAKLLLEFSIPAFVMMLVVSLYTVIDAAFLGNAVGADGIAVTTLAMPVTTVLGAFSSWAGQGGCTLAAISLGQGKRATAEQTLGNSTFLLIVFAAIAIVVGIFFMDPLLAIVGTTPDLWDSTKIFLAITFNGYIFQSLGMGLNGFLRTAGEPNRALWTSLLGTIGCVAFNYLFVMVLGWGVAGSAWANIVGQAIGVAPILWFFILNRKATFNLKLHALKPDAKLIGRILMIGLASFLMQLATTVITVVMNQMLVIYGALSSIGADGALSSVGLLGRIGFVVVTPIIGITMGAQPLIGYNYGAQQWHRVLKGLNLMLLWSVISAAVMWAIMELFPHWVVSLFGVSGNLLDYTVFALQIYVLVLPLVGYQIAGSSYFQSSGQPIKAAVLELTRQVIFLLPLYLFLPRILPQVFPQFTGLDAIIIASPVSDTLAVIVTSIFVIRETLKLKKLCKAQDDASLQPAVPDQAEPQR